MKWYEKLKLERERRGLSIRDVARETSISNGHISQIENGQISKPGFFNMLRVLSLYEVDVRDMWAEEPPEPAQADSKK